VSEYADQIRLSLTPGPLSAVKLMGKLGISQPTMSRAIRGLGVDAVRIREGRTSRYALRDNERGMAECPVYQVEEDGKIRQIGVLIPVRHEGYVMQQSDGATLFSEGIPWWLLDMRPQGFMGRAYASQRAQSLGLPASIAEWTDTQALRALIAHGHDATGNIVLGDIARDRFVDAANPVPIALQQRGADYARLANELAGAGETWSSAAGEQPKFAAYSETATGARHQIVKFTLPHDNPITERWRDLLLSEHHALQTLAQSGMAAARTEIVDHNGQRFLSVERFDRVGMRGRRAMFSLSAVDAEYTAMARSPWPVVATALAARGHIHRQASEGAALLYGYGTLIGNTDMHHGNLSFVSSHGRPYSLAPAYDMLPMGFQPRSGGGLSNSLAPANLHAAVPPQIWQRALWLATDLLQRLRADPRFSSQFTPCLDSLANHIAEADKRIARLAD
jgi:hypothetical protein